MFKSPFSLENCSSLPNPGVHARGITSAPPNALLVWFQLPNNTENTETKFVYGCSTVYIYITSERTNNRSWWPQALYNHLKQTENEMNISPSWLSANNKHFSSQHRPILRSWCVTTSKQVLKASWNVMAHAPKPDFVFRRNGRVHLNRRGGVSSVDYWQPRCAHQR